MAGRTRLDQLLILFSFVYYTYIPATHAPRGSDVALMSLTVARRRQIWVPRKACALENTPAAIELRPLGSTCRCSSAVVRPPGPGALFTFGASPI